MEYIKLKGLSEGEKAQFSHLNFCAGGNLGRAAGRTRVRLRNKESEIYTYNIKARIKNLCIGLEKGVFDINEFNELVRSLNLVKDLVDEIDYSPIGAELHWRFNILQQFIQNYLPYKYLKMLYYKRNLITE